MTKSDYLRISINEVGDSGKDALGKDIDRITNEADKKVGFENQPEALDRI
ncbi:MAG: hypothetical protein IT292_01030 [Deltaproteobacteria bacterium]|nr:hypothetical protein [Deltaproteobacteria bacterium]